MSRHSAAAAEATPASPPAQAAAPVPPAGWTEAALAMMVLIWAVNFSVVKRALDAFEPLGFNALRYALASAFVVAVLRARGPLRLPAREDLPRLLLLGVVGNVVYQLLFIYGINFTRAGNASVVMALTPLFIALLSWRVGHEEPSRLTWIGGACSVLGVVLVSRGALQVGGASRALLGDAMLVGAGMVWASYTVGLRPLIQRYGSIEPTAWTMCVGAVLLALIGVPSLLAQPWAAVGGIAWAGLLYSALLSIGLSYLIWYRGVERLGSTRTSIYSNLTPAVALVVAAIWLGERLTTLAVIGAALTIGGVMLVRSGQRAASRAPGASPPGANA